MKKGASLILLFFFLQATAQRSSPVTCDVLVVGGGTGGTAAALQSARMGMKTILMEPTQMPGGMLTAAGVSCTDGNDYLTGGIWRDFKNALYKHYGKDHLNTGWVSNTCFEPHVADSIFKAWFKAEKNLKVIYNYRALYVQTMSDCTLIVCLGNKNNHVIQIHAGITIDATELGDLLPLAQVPYSVGMDDPEDTGEPEAREKNNIIQDLTWAAVLKDYGPGTNHTIPRPAYYDSTLYFCSNTNAPCAGTTWNGDVWKMLNYGKLPLSPGETQRKFMLNWPAHGNDVYVNVIDSSDHYRKEAYRKAREYTKGFIYFIQTTLGLKQIGLADDELDHGLAFIPYNREGRRMKGLVQLNLNHIQNPYSYSLYKTGIACGDYPVDHHHARYTGNVPEIGFPPIPAYNIPAGVLIPVNQKGLLVCEKAISVTNLVNGTTRLQPVVLLTGQATGALAALSVQLKKQPRDVPVRALQQILLHEKCYLMPFTDVPVTHPAWEAIQKAGLCGILRGTGKPEGWENKMLFNPDSLVNGADLLRFYNMHVVQGFADWPSGEPDSIKPVRNNQLDFFFLARAYQLHKESRKTPDEIRTDMEEIWLKDLHKPYLPEANITRSDFAILLMNYFPETFSHDISIKGE